MIGSLALLSCAPLATSLFARSAAQTALPAAQALGVLGAGATAGWLGPEAVVGIAGLAGTAAALVLAPE